MKDLYAHKLKNITLITATLLLLSGCGIIAGKNKLYIYSNSTDTIIDVNSKTCVVPCVVEVGWDKQASIKVYNNKQSQDFLLKDKRLYPNIEPMIDVAFFIVPIIVDTITSYSSNYEMNRLYFYITNNQIQLLDLDNSVFAYCVYNYNDLLVEAKEGSGAKINTLAKLIDVDSPILVNKLKLSTSADNFSNEMAKIYVKKLVYNHYDELKENVRKGGTKKELQIIAMDSFNSYMDTLLYLDQSNSYENFLVSLFYGKKIKASYTYAVINYLNITKENKSSNEIYTQQLMDTSGLNEEQIKSILNNAHNAEDFAIQVKKLTHQIKVDSLKNQEMKKLY